MQTQLWDDPCNYSRGGACQLCWIRIYVADASTYNTFPYSFVGLSINEFKRDVPILLNDPSYFNKTQDSCKGYEARAHHYTPLC